MAEATCISHLPDHNLIFVGPPQTNTPEVPFWRWDVDKDQTSSVLSSHLQGEQTPYFSSDGISWSQSLSACTVDALLDMQQVTVTFSKEGHLIDDASAKAANEIFNEGIKVGGTHEISWTPSPRQMTPELAGPWIVEITNQHGTTLLSFTLEVVASCTWSDNSVAMTSAPFSQYQRDNDYIWAQFHPNQGGISVASRPSGFTNEDCQALADQPLEETLFLVESDHEDQLASAFVLSDTDPATITVKSPLPEAIAHRLADDHHKKLLTVSFLEKRGGLFQLRLRAPLTVGHISSAESFTSSSSQTGFEAFMP